METYVYKVARKLNGGVLGSAIIGQKSIYHLTYELKKITKPKIGRIFVFINQSDALQFKLAEYLDDTVILKCLFSGDLKSTEVVSFNYYDKDIEKFWTSQNPETIHAPTRTYLVESLEPIEIVN